METNTLDTLSESAIVTASAGSGKTHRLTTRLLELLLNKVNSENIIAQTFTRKAAGEIYARLIVRLIDLSSDQPQDPSIKIKLPKGYGLEVLRKLILKQDRLRIETIDSFFADLCKSYFIELGIPPNWEVADENQSNQIKIQAIKSAIKKVGLENFRILLDFLLNNKVPNKVLGSLLSEIKDFSSLISNTSGKAWGNLKELEPKFSLKEIQIKLEELLENRESIEVHGSIWNTLSSLVKAIESGDISYLCKSKFIEKISNQNFTYYNKPIPDPILEVLVNLITALQAEIINNTNSRTLSLFGILTAYQSEYLRRIKEQGKLAFSDISELISLKVDDLESSDLFSRLGMSLEHILLDEFQDTSPIQWKIIENLAQHILQSSSSENSVLIVGDAKQAIYGWRGGSAEVFNHLRKVAPHIKEETLAVNYRSNPGIIEFVNLVFSCLKDNESLSHFSEPINNWLEEFHTHIAHKKSKDHIVSVISYPEMAEDLEEQYQIPYQGVIEDIIGVQSSNSNATIAVLFRKNSEIDRFGAELRSQGIEYSSSTTSKLDSSYPIQLLISLTTLALHPEDRLSFIHLQNSKLDLGSLFGFEFEDASYASLYLRKQFLIEGFSRTLSRFSSLYLKTCSSELDKNIISLSISIALELERKGITNWQEWIDRICSTNVPSTNPSRLQLLSIHKAKGLEFDYVFIPALEDPIWRINNLKILKDEEDPFSPPKSIIRKPTEAEIDLVPELGKLRDSWIDSQIREALSLLYVSLTRAIKGTFIYIKPSARNIAEINIPSLADILRTALFYPEGVEPEMSVYQTYVPDTLDRPDKTETPFREYETLAWSSDQNKVAHPLKGLKILKKKKIGSQQDQEDSSVADIIDKIRQHESLAFGTLIHRCIEKISWLEPQIDSRKTADELVEFNKLLFKTPTLKAEATSYLAKALGFPEVRKIFLRESFTHNFLTPRILKEANLQIENDLFNLSGTIDRLVLCEEGDVPKEIYLYDFKTDLYINESKHKNQIAHYKDLIHAQWGKNSGILVKCFLVYLESGQIIEA